MVELIEGQPYHAGSIDRALLERQTLLTRATAPRLYAPPDRALSPTRRPVLASIAAGVTGSDPRPLSCMLALTRWCSRIPRDYPRADRSTAAGYYADFAAFRWGGSEEAVISKGSPWPQEISRVLASLLQLAGIQSRIIFLYRAEPPMLHTVVEAWVEGGWVVCDACANRCYIWPHRGYASALDLHNQPRLVDQAPEHGRNPYVDSSLYQTIGIADYSCAGGGTGAEDMVAATPADSNRLRAAIQVFKSQ